MKWYYIAIPVGLLLAYLLFSSKSTIIRSGGTSSGSGVGGVLTGIGNLLKGGGDAYSSVASSSSESVD